MAKKILFTSHTANFAKFNLPYIKQLRDQGYIVDYASAGEMEVPGVDHHFEIDFARSPFAFWKHVRAYRQLKKLMKREKYDFVHTHTPVGGVITRLAAKSLKPRPIIFYTTHGLQFYQGASKLDWLLYYPVEKYLARCTDCLVTINNEDYELVKRKFKPGRVERIHGVGVDLQKFHAVSAEKKLELRQKHGLQPKDFVLMYAAELNKNKDQGFLIENLPKLKEQIPRIKLLLAGVGKKEAELKRLVKRLGLTEQVKFLGYRQDLAEFYQLADVAVSASRREGLGLNLVEGMATGLPIVARNNRGHREIVVSPHNGSLFETAEEFRAAILDLYRFPDKRREIGAWNAKTSEKFALQKSLAKMDTVYHDYLD